MELMIVIPILIAVNFLVIFSRTVQSKWLRYLLLGTAIVLLLVGFFVVIRIFLQG